MNASAFRSELREAMRLVRPGKLAGALVALFAKQMRVRNASDFADYLICRTWDGTTEGENDIAVMRPWLLRRTPFHTLTRAGITYTYSGMNRRVADDGSQTETQVIVPSYVVGDVIVAVRGVALFNYTDVDGDAINWLQLSDGRMWSEENA